MLYDCRSKVHPFMLSCSSSPKGNALRGMCNRTKIFSKATLDLMKHKKRASDNVY